MGVTRVALVFFPLCPRTVDRFGLETQATQNGFSPQIRNPSQSRKTNQGFNFCKWAWVNSNYRPHAYQISAERSWALASARQRCYRLCYTSRSAGPTRLGTGVLADDHHAFHEDAKPGERPPPNDGVAEVHPERPRLVNGIRPGTWVRYST